jgi:hypothetical protein
MKLVLTLLGFLGCKAFPSEGLKSRATGISSAFEQCRKWIRDCSENHTVCQVENSVLPHRVVDIGHIGQHVCLD